MSSQNEYGTGSQSIADLERQESSLSGLVGTSGSHLENSAEFEVPEPSPTKDWKLPPLKPEEVYEKVKKFHLLAVTTIKIKEKSITCDANLNRMMKIPLITREEVDKALKKGYQYMHLGCVKIGINPLHRSGQNCFAFSALFDQRWTVFSKALLGGVQAPLNAGPVTYDARPNFVVSLQDPHILDVLTLGIQTSGYEDFKSKGHNIAIFYSTCVRFTNTQVPADLNSDKNTVTMMTYDEGLQPTAPHQIPRSQLRPPTNWITSWGSSSSTPSQSIECSTITEDNGTVITRFPQPSSNQSMPSAQRGGSIITAKFPTSVSSSSSIQTPTYSMHPDLSALLRQNSSLIQHQEQTNHLLSQLVLAPPTERFSEPNSYASPRYCNHPDCRNKLKCQKHKLPFGHSEDLDELHVMEGIPLHTEILIAVEENRNIHSKDKHPGLGFYSRPIPKERLQESPSKYKPTKAEIQKFLRIYKGISPYNSQDEWMKNMMSWDIFTHPKASQFQQEMEQSQDPKAFRCQMKEEWISYMKENNLWISFYEFYFSYGHPKGDDKLVSRTFPEHIVQQLSKKNTSVLFKRKTDDLNMHSGEPESSETPSTKRSKHSWRKPDGETIETVFNLPPYEDLQAEHDGKLTHFSPAIEE